MQPLSIISEDFDDDLYVEKPFEWADEEVCYKKRECGCGNCMDCLGMSWRDFF